MNAHNFRNIAGERFERVRVISYAGRTFHGESLWNCVCDCGTKFVTRGESLVRGATRSCGCIRKEKAAALAKAINHNTKAVRVIGEDGMKHFYSSEVEAARALGCSHKTVWNCLTTGRRFRNNLIQFAK